MRARLPTNTVQQSNSSQNKMPKSRKWTDTMDHVLRHCLALGMPKCTRMIRAHRDGAAACALR
eukprot:14941041-Alexandrium_andersonii.AAC.1